MILGAPESAENTVLAEYFHWNSFVKKTLGTLIGCFDRKADRTQAKIKPKETMF